MKNNIFTYEGPRGELVETFYQLLISGKIVSYEMILTKYDGGKLSTSKVSAHTFYKTLKHVVPELVDTFRKNGLSVITIPSGRTTNYQYVGSDKDPLKNIRFKALLKERYDTISDCINMRTAIRLTYWPFNRKKMEITFHPHLLYIFNGRFFAFGVSEMEGKEPFRKFSIALDRINGDIRGSGAKYIPAEVDEYNFLAHLVGVRMEETAKLETIRLRAHDQYTFGRLITKPLHDSQKIVQKPNWKEGKETGDVEIQVYPNVELVGQILSYGSTLEVISPQEFRERIRKELEFSLNRYNSSEQ
ncbi:MAG: WYL domain-containing protein [Muribaculaceae bacterium]|nr:WYL domain-containing protein [Muribaculaceae bacterium]